MFFHIMQISKKTVVVDVYGPRGFSVEHIEQDLCEKFQVNQTHCVRVVAFQGLGLKL